MNELLPVDAITVGVNTVDVLVQLPEHFTPGEKLPVRDSLIQGGGMAGTAACVLAALGWRTGFITPLSNDALSTISRADFKRYGVIDDYFITDPNVSPIMAVIHVDTKNAERTIFWNAKRFRLLRPSDVPLEAVRRAKLIVADRYEKYVLPTILEAVREAGGRSVLDIEAAPPGAADPEIAFRLLELATDCILPLSEARTMTGEDTPELALRRLAKRTTAQLVVTDGVRGSWALSDDNLLHQPAFSVVAVDTTGCGDAYHGAYGAGLLEGLPLSSRMELAAWVAAQVARELGARSNLPTRHSLRDVDTNIFSTELRMGLLSMFQKRPNNTENTAASGS
jgi:sulfofructose kinase